MEWINYVFGIVGVIGTIVTIHQAGIGKSEADRARQEAVNAQETLKSIENARNAIDLGLIKSEVDKLHSEISNLLIKSSNRNGTSTTAYKGFYKSIEKILHDIPSYYPELIQRLEESKKLLLAHIQDHKSLTEVSSNHNDGLAELEGNLYYVKMSLKKYVESMSTDNKDSIKRKKSHRNSFGTN